VPQSIPKRAGKQAGRVGSVIPEGGAHDATESWEFQSAKVPENKKSTGSDNSVGAGNMAWRSARSLSRTGRRGLIEGGEGRTESNGNISDKALLEHLQSLRSAIANVGGRPIGQWTDGQGARTPTMGRTAVIATIVLVEGRFGDAGGRRIGGVV
jgi:hypothetical protein